MRTVFLLLLLLWLWSGLFAGGADPGGAGLGRALFRVGCGCAFRSSETERVRFFRLSCGAAWFLLDSICVCFRCAGSCPPLFVSCAFLLCAISALWFAPRFRFTGACVQSVSASCCVCAQGRSVPQRVQTARSGPAMVLFATMWG